MGHATFSHPERNLALIAGLLNIVIGLGFFLLPEFRFPLWPTGIPDLLDRFIGAIILGNGAGALLLSREKEWARVRPLALVATVYGTLVALALLYHLFILKAPAIFWVYFISDVPFLLVFYALFVYHDFMPDRSGAKQGSPVRHANAQLHRESSVEKRRRNVRS